MRSFHEVVTVTLRCHTECHIEPVEMHSRSLVSGSHITFDNNFEGF